MILLDTHVALWLSDEFERLSPAATSAIQRARADGGLAISSITLFEIAHLIVRKRITVLSPLDAYLRELEQRFVIKQITPSIAQAAAQFPDQSHETPWTA